jgi:hypothetical protein
MVTADIHHVPADLKTIQEAINASQNGDTVLVDHGEYFENISFMGKAITVASQFIMDREKVHIDETVINGTKPTNPDAGSTVSFVSGEDTTSVLCGFTITGGTGTSVLTPGFPPMRQGGGFINGPPFMPTISILGPPTQPHTT